MFVFCLVINRIKFSPRMYILFADNNITVVATGVSTNNDVNMPPHIQILSADHTEQQQHHVQMQDGILSLCYFCIYQIYFFI